MHDKESQRPVINVPVATNIGYIITTTGSLTIKRLAGVERVGTSGRAGGQVAFLQQSRRLKLRGAATSMSDGRTQAQS